MKTYRTLTTLGGTILAASLALAQMAPPAPPAPPDPPARPARAPRAMPPEAPEPAQPATAAWPTPRALFAPEPPEPAQPAAAAWPAPRVLFAPQAMPAPAAPPAPRAKMDMDMQFPVDVDLQLSKVQEQLDNMHFDIDVHTDWLDAQQKAMEKAQEKLEAANMKMADKFNFDPSMNKMLAMQQAQGIGQGIGGRGPVYAVGPRGSDESMYGRGLQEIDNRQYDQALSEFNNVVAHAGAKAEGALYWKAYVLNKLGRAADAQASIDALRKTYPSSTWLEDAKALELEVKQSKGPVSPENETDDDLKVLALNGLLQSDPEKYLPQVETLLKGSHSPNLKRQALYVIAQNNTPQAQQLLEQIARHGNPDLQAKAVQYLSQKRNPNTPQILLEIYTSTNDPAVKRAILDSFGNTKDKDRLMQVLKAEKDGTLRSGAINKLGEVDGQPELWQIYQSETSVDGKIAILDVMRQNGNLEKLTEVARTDKEPRIRQRAVQIIATQQSGTPYTTLVTLYGAEQDEKVKQTIINSVGESRDCKPMVDLARAEKTNMQLKLRIVQRLSDKARSCPAATDYLTELLNK